MHCGPRCKGHECRMKRHAKPAERLHDTEKILARVSLVEELQHRIIHGFDRTGHKETACIAKSGQLLLIFEQVFRSEEHTSELQSQSNIVCRLLLEKKKHT